LHQHQKVKYRQHIYKHPTMPTFLDKVLGAVDLLWKLIHFVFEKINKKVKGLQLSLKMQKERRQKRRENEPKYKFRTKKMKKNLNKILCVILISILVIVDKVRNKYFGSLRGKESIIHSLPAI